VYLGKVDVVKVGEEEKFCGALVFHADEVREACGNVQFGYHNLVPILARLYNLLTIISI